MRIWRRAGLTVRCGLCGGEIHRGDPVLAISVAGVHRVLWRCDTCLPAPADLPPLVEPPPPEPIPLVRFTADSLPLDWKTRATGDREPGEDDA